MAVICSQRLPDAVSRSKIDVILNLKMTLFLIEKDVILN